MGQREILQFLKENYRSWFSATTISEHIGNHKSSTVKALIKLRQGKWIYFTDSIPKLYKYKKMK